MTVGKVKDFSFSYKGSIGRGSVKKFEDGGMYGDGSVSDADMAMAKQPQAPQLTPMQKRRMQMQQASQRQAAIAKQAQEQGAMSDMDSRMMERGYKKGGDVDSVSVKDIKSGKVKQSTDEDYYGMAKDAPMPPRRPAGMKKGGMAHDDAAEDKKMIKSMIKPSALKKADGGTITPRKQAAFAKKANSVPVAPRAPMIPQQVMPAGALASIGEGGIGVGRARPGQPNVGAIRAAMAKKASMAMPENAPSMMKKGGKVGC